MADNLAVTPGSGATMAADEATDGTLGSVKIPFAKIMDGTLDSTNKLVINSSGEALTKSKITDGTNTVNVLKSDGTAADQNAQLMSPTYLSVPFTTTTAQAVGTTDAGNYRWVSVHTTSQGTSSSINFQGSNDNSNWVAVALTSAGTVDGTSPSTSTTLSGRIDAGPLSYRYFRLNVTGISAGTTAGTIVFSTAPTTPATSRVSVDAASATGSAVPANAFYMAGSQGGNLVGFNAAGTGASDGISTASNTFANYNLFYNGTNWDRFRGNTTDGLQVYTKGTASDNSITGTKVIAAASTNATSVKASAGKIYLIHAYNSDTVGYWVKMYNKASAPTVGTDVPVATMYAPPGGGFVIAADLGNYYSTGIALATTLLATDADTTAVTNANKLVINLRYV